MVMSLKKQVKEQKAEIAKKEEELLKADPSNLLRDVIRDEITKQQQET